MKKYLLLTLFTISIGGCFFSEEDKQSIKSSMNETFNLGEININYYSDKSVSSLEVPPDLTKPDYQKSFRLSQYVKNIETDTVNFSDKAPEAEIKILSPNNLMSKISVKKEGSRRWLVVDKDPDTVWNGTKDFFKLQGFVIEKSNKKIGIMETNFLENTPVIPEQSVGLIRSMLQKALKQRYALPIIDKFRIRIEPTSNGEQSQLFLTMFSMEEVLTNQGTEEENTIWQTKSKDLSVETEMLYRLMLYLGGEASESKEKILLAKEEKKFNPKVTQDINGYAKLLIDASFLEAWDTFSWAIDEAAIELSDKDIMERSFYIQAVRTADQGILTKILGAGDNLKTFKLTVKEISPGNSELYFFDISEENEMETKEFSFDLLNKIYKTLI